VRRRRGLRPAGAERVGEERVARRRKKELTVTEAVRNFSEVLGRVRFRGERFVLLEGGKPVAEPGPTEPAPVVRLGDLPAVRGSWGC
jgi:hypothetical protein